MRIAAGVEYRGADFYGWQKQDGQRTVQACVEIAVSSVANHPVKVQCAGRTDAGVHAVQQVIHFDTSSNRTNRSWVLGINSLLPGDINLLWVKTVPDKFHSRFSAISRRYKYIVLNRPIRSAIHNYMITLERHPLNVESMAEAAIALVGEHDFTSYRAVSCQAKSPVRNINTLDVARKGNLVIIDVEANAFLHHMVRNIAGVLMTIGKGREPVHWARQVLEARDRTMGGITAPADGLYLVNVCYDGIFEIPELESGIEIIKIYSQLE